MRSKQALKDLPAWEKASATEVFLRFLEIGGRRNGGDGKTALRLGWYLLRLVDQEGYVPQSEVDKASFLMYNITAEILPYSHMPESIITGPCNNGRPHGSSSRICRGTHCQLSSRSLSEGDGLDAYTLPRNCIDYSSKKEVTQRRTPK